MKCTICGKREGEGPAGYCWTCAGWRMWVEIEQAGNASTRELKDLAKRSRLNLAEAILCREATTAAR